MNNSSIYENSFLLGGGEMGKLIREKVWDETSLGNPSGWKQSLKTTITILLNTRFPMFLFWGPDLICFYNDAYRASLGTDGKHPGILGEKAEVAWADIWPVVAPLINKVLIENESTWSEDQLIPIFRNGRIEDVYWTFSHSSVQDDDGVVAGVLVVCTETTAKVNAYKLLEDSKRYYNNIMQAPVAMCVFIGSEHVVEIVNAKMLEIWGKTAEETLNKPIFEGLPEARGQGLEEIINTVYNTGERFVANERMLMLPRNGRVETLYLNFVYEALTADNGTSIGIVATATDVTIQVEARMKIEESEKRFRYVADSAPVLIWMSGIDMSCHFFNKAWLIFTGKTMEQEWGSGWADGIHPEDLSRCLATYINAFNAREEFYMEYRLKRADGAYRWISVNGVPRYTIDNTFEGYIGACMDIHEQTIYQEKLKENEERLNVVIAASELGNFEFNFSEGKLLYSPRYLQIFGHSKDTEKEHADFLKQIHPSDLDKRNEAMQYAINSGVLGYEARIVWEDNSVHWMEVRGKVFYDVEDKPIKLIGTIRDTTKIKKHQQELEEREQKFRLLADSMPQHVWTADTEGNLNYFNRSVFDYSGLSPEEISAVGWLAIVHPEDRDENVKHWMHAVKTGTEFLFEHRFRRHDGTYRWQLSRAIPQRNPDGETQMWVGTSTDIETQKTFTRELERQVHQRTRQLEEKNQELEKMNVELNSFAYVSSHDLQEPLRKIQTFANRIIEKEERHLSPKGLDYFRRMQQAANRMQMLIEDLLTYSRTNTSERIFETLSLTDLLDEVKADLKETLIEKNAILYCGKMCDVCVVPFQFRQLLTNLIGNSIKFAKTDIPPLIKIESEIKIFHEENEHNLPLGQSFCHIRIEDNGIGFDQQYNERIFEVFQRLHSKEDYSGTGIGLAIVKKIVENHNGYIIAKGKAGVGATFNIYINNET
ncbi:MAG: PAS domain S-box protein [Taibaiella sp.]|nr:PAS domain S-box protein [Taibaiella sp.]